MISKIEKEQELQTEITSRETLYTVLCEENLKKDYKEYYNLYYEKAKAFLKAEEDYRNFAEYYGKKHSKSCAKSDIKTVVKLIKTILKHFNMDTQKTYEFFKNDSGLTYSHSLINEISEEFSFELIELEQKKSVVLELFEADFPITHSKLYSELEFKINNNLISINEEIAYKSGLLDELIRISKFVFKSTSNIEHVAFALGGISSKLALAIAELNEEEEKQIF